MVGTYLPNDTPLMMNTDSSPPSTSGDPPQPVVRYLIRRGATRRTKQKPPEAVEKWVALIKAIVEIAAVLIAAWWAYSRYFAGEAPSLVLCVVNEETYKGLSVSLPSIEVRDASGSSDYVKRRAAGDA